MVADMAVHALLYRAELEPGTKYVVTLETEGGEVGFNGVGVYTRGANATGETTSFHASSGGGLRTAAPTPTPTSGAGRVSACAGLGVAAAALLFL
jgi:hypothetical protein